MKEDIQFKKVEEIAIAIVPEEGEQGEESWKAYLINLKNKPIHGVIVNSRGYGTLDGKKVKTSVLRHFFEKVDANTHVPIEFMPKKLFGLHNEFWVSFWCGNFMYDKKYVFVSESFIEDNLTDVPILDTRGVMIK